MHKIEKEVRRWAKQHQVDLIDTSFYTKQQWLDRGEPYGNNAVFSIATEGGLYRVLNEGPASLYTSFNELVNSLGYWFEQGFAWSVHFYNHE